jgi:8-oxo-dGTP diphosphatase
VTDEDSPLRYGGIGVTVDVVLATVRDGAVHVLLARRAHEPAAGAHALPGVFVGDDERLEAAATRALRRKAGLDDVFLEQLYTFAEPGRDPRGRVLSVAYYALVPAGRLEAALAGASPADGLALARIGVPWEGESGGPVAVHVGGAAVALPFDHAAIISLAILRLRGKLDYAPIGFRLLPDRFTLRELLRVHEAILGRPLPLNSFRRRMLESGQLLATGEREQGRTHRPGELYRVTDAARAHPG